MKKQLFTFFMMMGVSVFAHAAIEVHQFDSADQEQQFQELSQTLRCPKCQNNTIGDSNAELAKDLREKVYEMIKSGKSDKEIIDYMVARYGNFVTYNPPFNAGTSVLWLGPLAVLVFGFGFIVMRSRRKTAVKDKEWDDNKEARLQALLDDEKGDKS